MEFSDLLQYSCLITTKWLTKSNKTFAGALWMRANSHAQGFKTVGRTAAAPVKHMGTAAGAAPVKHTYIF